MEGRKGHARCPLEKLGVSNGEGGRQECGTVVGSMWVLGWDPTWPLEDARGRYGMAGRLPGKHGNRRLLHNAQALGTAE